MNSAEKYDSEKTDIRCSFASAMDTVKTALDRIDLFIKTFIKQVKFMPLLIDGFNLIYKFPDLEAMMYSGELNAARAGLLDKLKEYQKIKKTAIRVVFDGKKDKTIETTSEKIGKIDVYYSLDYSADYLIKQFIKKDLNPKMTTVITSDKDIIFYINRFGAKNITSEKFADIVNSTFTEFIKEKELQHVMAEKEHPVVSEEEISYWQKLFRKK